MSHASMTLAAALFLSSAGCYTTWDIPVKEINKLDGYRAPVARVILDTEGDEVQVDHKTDLQFWALPPGQGVPPAPLQEKFNAIAVHVGPNQWWLTGILHDDGTAIRVDMSQVGKVVARRYSHGKTAGLAVGIAAGAIALTVALALGIAIASIPND
jgi:hypothetical protein